MSLTLIQSTWRFCFITVGLQTDCSVIACSMLNWVALNLQLASNGSWQSKGLNLRLMEISNKGNESKSERIIEIGPHLPKLS